MSRKANPAVVGMFVIGAIVLLTLAILIFGSGQFLVDKPIYVTSFKGSVKGLRIGAPVTFRGVKVGEVVEILLRIERTDMEVTIPVYFELIPASISVIKDGLMEKTEKPTQMEARKGIYTMISEQGLRAQLQSQSMVTGQLQIELDFHPDTEPVLTGIDPDTPEIPSIQSGLQKLFEEMEEIPLAEIARNVSDALSGIEEIVNSDDTRDTLKSLRASADHLEALLGVLNKELPSMSSEFNQSLGEFNSFVTTLNEKIGPLSAEALETLEGANSTMKNLDDATRGASGLGVDMRQTLRELKSAAQAFKLLVEQLETRPESLLKGKSGGTQ
jgi:paraquat-inducible protein B